MFARLAAAAVGVGTCWPWETAATLPSARPREAGPSGPLGRRGAGACRGGRPPTACYDVAFQLEDEDKDEVDSRH